jgi:23S rRNA (pseudouridine1915-N3)-methyltransferase
MEIVLLSINKTKNLNLNNLIEDYEKRINYYVKFSSICSNEIKNSKKLSQEELKDKEASWIQKNIKKGDLFILLDKSGISHSSEGFAKFLNKKYNSNYKRIIFIIGGPYGFSKSIYSLKSEKISLSKMTFTHQMSRLFFCEQFYRANTILKNENYHHN